MSGVTPDTVRRAAELALALLSPASASDKTFEAGDTCIRLQGPDIPATVPMDLATPDDVATSVDFQAQYTLTIDAPRRVLELTWSAGEALRILCFSRGDWEQELAILSDVPAISPPGDAITGTSWMRMQGTRDALLNRVLTDNDLSEVPLSNMRTPETHALTQRPRELAPERDGPVSSEASQKSAADHVQLIRAKATALGVTKTGIIDLRPEFIQIGKQLDHKWVIGLVNAEPYANVLGGAAAVEWGAHDAYRQCAESATSLARYIREELGYSALAHHNGGCEVQALPALYHAGIGELGRHGSLINPDIGAFWRPGFVTTNLPLEGGAPLEFGVQDYCLKCRLCETACPGDAISPAADFIVTGGIKRWLIDNEKCFPYSRLKEEYCHICVDVCPYIHKENGDAQAKRIFKEYLGLRKAAGAGAAKSGVAAASANQ
ncbi:MAG: 4Fe-4S dicluster domain-containing protein [Rhodospirillaceae bacterium]|nr:4Fe-4S dicluster domain-containing protein [Rhodospirillaceae bacterium]